MPKPENVQTVKTSAKKAFFLGRIAAVKPRLPKPLKPWLEKVPHDIPILDVRTRTYKTLAGNQDLEAIELLERIADAYEAEQREEEICQ